MSVAAVPAHSGGTRINAGEMAARTSIAIG
jgi:hypothetical protein